MLCRPRLTLRSTNALTLLGQDANEARSAASDLEEEIRNKATSIV